MLRVLCLLSILLHVSLAAVQFTALTVKNVPMCAVASSPSAITIPGKSIAPMCEEWCADHVTGCLRYNFYSYPNKTTICQVFTNKPTAYASVPNCQHYTADVNDRYRVACPAGYTYTASNRGCYKVTSDSVNWRKANDVCKKTQQGAHLVSIYDQPTSDALTTFIDPWPASCSSFWTSGRRRTKDDLMFQWMNNLGDKTTWLDFTYTNWRAGEPNNMGSQNCVEAYTDFTWNDQACESERCVVCQVDLV